MEILERNKKVIVAGHISLDITPEFQNSGKQKLSELLRPGKLLQVGKAQLCAGGAVSNTGLGLHKLGGDVLLMARIGDDDFGQSLRSLVKAHGCESCINVVPGEFSSYTIVIAPKGLDRFFLHNPGCNDMFSCADVNFEKVKEASHFHFGYPTVMRKFYEDEGQELYQLFKQVKEMGVTTSLDLTAVDPDSEAARCDWEKILEKVLPFVDFFVPSIEELGYMLDKELYRQWEEKAQGDDIISILSVDRDVKPLADKVLGMGAKAVLLKCGAAGMYLGTAAENVFQKELPMLKGWGDFSHFETSFVPDRVLSATGAGDTSIAAFIKAMLDGLPPAECVMLAAATGASCVTAYDSVSGLLTFDELRKKINNGWKKQALCNSAT